MTSTSTRLVALLGNPVAHSLSPAFQNAAFQAAGVDGVYLAVRCEPTEVAGLIRGIARSGGAGNITLPHKEEAARVVEFPSDLVVRTRACNTFWLDSGKICGENTDVAGFQGAVQSLLGMSASGLRVLLLGAGGSARGVLTALLDDGANEIVLLNRTAEKAHLLAEELGGGRTRVSASPEEVESSPFDLIVNTTSLGLSNSDRLPIALERLRDPGALLDIAYRPDETPLVHRAREIGIPAADGGEMLVLQGAESFRLWWGIEPSVSAMRGAREVARRRGVA
jgi:shikimate dehydrogenase